MEKIRIQDLDDRRIRGFGYLRGERGLEPYKTV
jgi:hypothetical protein